MKRLTQPQQKFASLWPLLDERTRRLMAASLASAIRERIIKGKNTGLIIFGIALVVTAALLTYTKISNGYL